MDEIPEQGGAQTPDAGSDAAATPEPSVAAAPSRIEKARAARAAKLAKRERDRQRREARKAAAAARDAQPEKAPEPEIDEAKLRRSLAVALHIPWWICSLVARIFGYRAAELTRELADEHAEHWIPIALHYRWLATAARWIAAPVLLVRDFVTRLERRDKHEAAPPAKPGRAA